MKWKKHGVDMCCVVMIVMLIALIASTIICIILCEDSEQCVTFGTGILGAIIGGVFALYGVKITLKAQDKEEKERKRLENLPILSAKQRKVKKKDYPLYATIIGHKVTTTDFEINLDMPDRYDVLEIYPVNGKTLFDAKLVAVAMDVCGECKKECFDPGPFRLAGDEKYIIAPYLKDISGDIMNHIVVLRFRYSDLFGNIYYQDVPMDYSCNIDNNSTVKNFFEILAMPKPMYKSEVISIDESLKNQVRIWHTADD